MDPGTAAAMSRGRPIGVAAALACAALAAAPAAGMSGVEAESTLSYNGELIIITRRGTLEISDVGVFDQAAGKFTELDRVIAGTGMFANASGVLFISGDSYADGSGFDGRISGELCLVK